MLRAFLVILSVFTLLAPKAQDLDSLKFAAEKAPDSTAFKIYVNIAQRIMMRDPHEALIWVHKAENAAKRTSNLSFIANAYIGKGYIHNGLESRDSAEYYYRKAYELYQNKGEYDGLYMASLNLGSFYAEKGNYERALPLYVEALEASEQTGDLPDRASALLGLGMLHKFLGNPDMALKNYNRSLKVLEESGRRIDSIDIANIKQNKAAIYKDRGEYNKALQLNIDALEIRRSMGDSLAVIDSYINLAESYKYLKEYDRAKKYAQLAIDRLPMTKDPVTTSKANQVSGEVFLKTGDLVRAKIALEKAYEASKQIGSKEDMRRSTKLLSQLYAQIGDYRSAYQFHKEFHAIYDSIYSEDLHSRLAELQSQYDLIQAEKEIEGARRERAEAEAYAAKADEKNARQKLYISIATGAVLLLLVGLIFLVRSIRNKQKTNRAILHQKLIVEEKNKEITDSINYAKRLQDAILPTNDLLSNLLTEHFVLFKPKDIVSGDFYSVIKEGQDVYVAVVDCTGHGVPGAMMSLVGDMALKRSIKEFGIKEPGKILDKMTELVKERFEESDHSVKDGMDMGLVKLSGNSIEFAGANNPLWVIKGRGVSSEGRDPNSELRTQNSELLHEVKADKQPIGPHILDHKPFTTHKVSIEKGDTVYLFSDGYADQFGGEKGKKFKYSNLKNLLISIQDQGLDQQQRILEDTLEEWMGSLEQLDDICILGIRTFISKDS